MEDYNIPNSDDVYYYIKDHFGRWNDRYNRMSTAIQNDEELENAELSKYTSAKRDSVFMQNYSDQLDEYYNYIEKTLLEMQTQKR